MSCPRRVINACVPRLTSQSEEISENYCEAGSKNTFLKVRKLLRSGVQKHFFKSQKIIAKRGARTRFWFCFRSCVNRHVSEAPSGYFMFRSFLLNRHLKHRADVRFEDLAAVRMMSFWALDP
jgi:hypothetical protein